MTKKKVVPSTQAKAAQSAAEVELVPDAWERFEKAVDKVAKSPPQHKLSAQSKEKTTCTKPPKAIP